MGSARLMQRFAKWHIWFGWLVGVPMLIWTLSGLVMVARPIEEVRGSDRLIELKPTPLAPDTRIEVMLPAATTKPVLSVSTQVERGETITRIAYADGTMARFREDGSEMAPLSEIEARMIVAEGFKGGDQVAGSQRFAAADAPADLRKAIDSWQVTLTDGTHVYVGTTSGRIEAVRTRWWRFYDVMWGLHIMDLQTREDTHHPILIFFAALSAAGALLGCVLMFRRRKARVQVA